MLPFISSSRLRTFPLCPADVRIYVQSWAEGEVIGITNMLQLQGDGKA